MTSIKINLSKEIHEFALYLTFTEFSNFYIVPPFLRFFFLLP